MVWLTIYAHHSGNLSLSVLLISFLWVCACVRIGIQSCRFAFSRFFGRLVDGWCCCYCCSCGGRRSCSRFRRCHRFCCVPCRWLKDCLAIESKSLSVSFLLTPPPPPLPLISTLSILCRRWQCINLWLLRCRCSAFESCVYVCVRVRACVCASEREKENLNVQRPQQKCLYVIGCAWLCKPFALASTMAICTFELSWQRNYLERETRQIIHSFTEKQRDDNRMNENGTNTHFNLWWSVSLCWRIDNVLHTNEWHECYRK